MQNGDSFAQQHASAHHIVSFFRKVRLEWLLLTFRRALFASSAVMQRSLPQSPEHCYSDTIREFCGQEYWQRLFHFQRQAR